jgi:hypothetical protein
MISLASITLATALSYFQAYPREARAALDFASEHKTEIKELKKYLSDEDARLAMCIVAPEVSQYSTFSDKAETFALYTLYVQGHSTNFSIGLFQMKPSFAVDIENEVTKHEYLSKYKSLIINKPTDRAARNERVQRLTTLRWQLVYLAAFVDIARQRTKGKSFATTEEMLKYWGTLYNAGVNIADSKIYRHYSVEGFPRISSCSFNYGDVCIEFYHDTIYCSFLTE